MELASCSPAVFAGLFGVGVGGRYYLWLIYHWCFFFLLGLRGVDSIADGSPGCLDAQLLVLLLDVEIALLFLFDLILVGGCVFIAERRVSVVRGGFDGRELELFFLV